MWAVLEIAIGLVTIFLLVSIVVSGINEWFANWLSRRGQFLRVGLQRLISDDAVYRRVINHPLVASLYREGTAKGRPPSYVSPETFALALANVLLARSRGDGAAPTLSAEALRAALRSPALIGSSVATSLTPIVERAGDNLDAVMQGIQNWFSHGMDRVSGWYKGRTRLMLFLIGLALAALANIDAIEIAATLNRSPALRTSIAAVGDQIVSSAEAGTVKLRELNTRPPTEAEWQSIRPVLEGLGKDTGQRLPIGYECLGTAFESTREAADSASRTPTRSAQSTSVWAACRHEWQQSWQRTAPANALLKLIGWLITAMAATMGAGFWFGLLTKAVNIRGTGPKPNLNP